MRRMKVPVLYGSEGADSFRSSAEYVAGKLGVKLENVWDGFATQEIPDTPESTMKELLEFVPETNISFRPEDRYSHSLGMSSPEMLMARNSAIERTVDAVIYPDYRIAAEILRELHARKYGAVIYGGGTSVSGSLQVGKGRKTVSIDTKNFKQLRLEQGYAVIGSGFRGMEVENKLNSFGYTLGNFPESMLHSTVGGWVATKATGQESNLYGGIERLVLGVNMTTSSGQYSDGEFPRKSTGFDYKDIAIGSDGKYGLVTDVVMKLFKVPERRYFSSYVYRSFKDGIDALAKSERFPAVARLSDELETEFAFNTAGDGAMVGMFRKYVNFRTGGKGALLVVVNNDFAVTPVLTNSVSTGSAPAKSWIKGRYSRPGIANALWKGGLVPDTLETSTTWDNLYPLYKNVKGTFQQLKSSMGFKGEIMAHVSHLYRSGACIYFTFIIKAENDLDVLMKVREELISCFVSNGGTVTHHHGKGLLFEKNMDKDLEKLQEKLADPLFSGDSHNE